MRRNEQRDEGIYGPYPRRLREVQHVADTREEKITPTEEEARYLAARGTARCRGYTATASN